jgi:thioesterase domain-containing protein/acyl carrier protein
MFTAGEDYVAPRDEIEMKLVGLWSELLNIQPEVISIDRSFFELGGHSLKATVLASRIHKEFDVIIALGEIFKAPTIKALGEYIKNSKSHIYKNIDWNLVLIKEGLAGDKHLFFIHDGSGEVEGYVEFCQHLSIDFNCWGIRANRLDNLAPRNITIPGLAKTYIDFIRQIQSHGPYYIAGWSLGGTIAFEIIAQLEQINEEVACLILFDSPPPDKSALATAEEFSLESEMNFIKNYNTGVEVTEIIRNRPGIELNQFWPFVKDYLEAMHFDVELLKKLIVENRILALPNFEYLDIKDSIYYLNMARTLRSARARYIPNNNLKTDVHYFKASQSIDIEQRQWEKYCHNPITYYTINGDHFSIFKIPGVLELAGIFNKIDSL